MRIPAACSLLTLAAVQSGWALAAGEDPLQPGRYEVQVRVELPHINDLDMVKTAAVCVVPDDGGSRGLAVLGDNNPLARCPASGARREADVLTFSIACPGPNAAWAKATYALAGDSFRGRIEMNMGGKNMTMAETQVGRRVGDCGEPGPS